jgi:hypothetical protein
MYTSCTMYMNTSSYYHTFVKENHEKAMLEFPQRQVNSAIRSVFPSYVSCD